jgi:glucan 1,3-beta-glucosidase
MTEQIRGVNLGGWLILEKWLTSGVFAGTDAVDEYTFMQHPNSKKRIEQHRKTFITEKDFKWIHDNGINLVRIPVGYWLFADIDGYTSTVKYLDDAIKWAQKYDLKVLIDLHGARGSQNGFDSSGRKGGAEWFTNREYQNETIELLCQIAKRYTDSPALWGIELLNEPMPKWRRYQLVWWHRHAYKQLTRILLSGTHIVFHDAFQPLLSAGTLWPFKNHPVMMDTHWYGFAFKTNDLQKYLYRSALLRKLILRLTQSWHPVIVGEWSTVLPQRFFDAVPVDQHMELLRQNAEMQMNMYKKSAGWIYWNYKAQGDGMWNFRDLVERGVIKVEHE